MTEEKSSPPAASSASRPGIRHISYYLPEKVRENAELVEALGLEEAFIVEKLGVLKRRIAADDEATSDLCAAAVRRLFEETGESPEDIGGLIVVTQTPDYVFPQTSALVQHACGLGTNTIALDIQLGCSGWVYGLSVAEGLMKAHGLSKLVLVAAEKYSSLLRPNNRATLPLFGDSATATLLTVDDPLYHTGQFTFGTDGSLAETIITRGSGTAPGEGHGFEMDGRAVFNFVMQKLPGDLKQCLAKNGLEVGDVSTWVFHQASRYMVENLAIRMRIPLERAIVDMADGGNTGPCTIPLALARQVLNRSTLPDVVGISGFGVGASWASSFLFVNARED